VFPGFVVSGSSASPVAVPNCHLMTVHFTSDDTTLATLANGVRALTISAPQLETVAVSVFVRTGSAHETRPLNGISHFVEHMVFKGTQARDCRRINLDAERLGAVVDAHTDKDHTAFHMSGLAHHAPQFIDMLAELVCSPTFPADELERERQVLLHELAEDEDDPMTLAFQLFDRACYGLHPLAQPVIGTRANIERLSRDDLVAYVNRQYTGANVVVAVAGPMDGSAVAEQVAAAFGALPRGQAHALVPPIYAGGVRVRPLAGSSQTHVVLGFPIPARAEDDPASMVAAALFGEGMSSPLLDQVREQRGLVYHAGCSADVMDGCGQFVIEASTGPDKLDELLRAVMALLDSHTRVIDPVDLERARNQIAVRLWRAEEQPVRRLEGSVLDLYAHGRLRTRQGWMDRIMSVTADDVRGVFQRMMAAGPALAIAGKVPRGAGERARDLLAGHRLALARALTPAAPA
jgi:predicted Zn-dependent peptidase